MPHQPDDDAPSRRVFVRNLTFMGGGVVLLGSACKEQPKAPPPAPRPEPLSTSHRTFTNDEFPILAAAVDRMLPKDEDPGAIEARVPEYIDRMLQTPQLAKMREDFIPGLAALDRRCRRLHQVSFAVATDAQRDEVLNLFKNAPENSGEARWYEILLALTMEGFLGDPSYGGNHGEVGWKLVGFTLVGRNVKADPGRGYDGAGTLQHLRCGDGKGC